MPRGLKARGAFLRLHVGNVVIAAKIAGSTQLFWLIPAIFLLRRA